MRDITRQIELVAQGDRAPVLLVGESGTGKGRLAEYIHSRSARSSFAFVELSCATTDRETMSAELFGDEAPGGQMGLLVAANGGSVFVDEISDLSYDLQLRLLHALDGAHPVSDADRPPGVRIIAASCKDLVSEVNAGRFREDLYYRLSVTPIHLPPLRARSREDLAELITATFNALSMNISSSPRMLGEEVIDCLIAYPWPGNIRELRNALERALLVARGEPVLQRAHLPAELHDIHGSDVPYTPRTLMDVERAHIHRTLRAHNLNRTHAARELGISRATLIKKIKEYGLVYRSPGHP
jgi:transcriptional regulator with PAS, ATPase and Fis domain